uniref:Uncharacterized protein n=1 Tax=Rhizophora mucronata TaxID=61149 RepID=A0A2P2MWJ0_RHIMU
MVLEENHHTKERKLARFLMNMLFMAGMTTRKP